MSDQQEYIDSLGVLLTCEYIAPANREWANFSDRETGFKWHVKLIRGNAVLETLYTTSLADTAPVLYRKAYDARSALFDLWRGDHCVWAAFPSGRKPCVKRTPQLAAILKHLARMDALANTGLLQQADGMQIESKAELDAYLLELAMALDRRPALHEMFTSDELAKLANQDD